MSIAAPSFSGLQRSVHDFHRVAPVAESVPLVLAGREVARIPAVELLP